MTVRISRRAVLQATALMGGLAAFPGLAQPARGFTHSVASGEPFAESVLLWTRFVADDGGETRLVVEVAEDERFARIVSRGSATAGPDSDFCARARVTGLAPGRWYFYRFRSSNGTVSPTGRTRTLPAGRLDQFRIAVMSCANATSGWFTGYAHAALRDDIDLIVHTGDYIYESPINRADALAALATSRGIQPAGETVSLMDYRLRYASYRADTGLQELHRRFPMILMWDDHEVANNSWSGGAANHDEGEGSWEARKTAGMRAYREWLPVSDRDYERYQIGDLATLFRLETRLLARSQPLNIRAALAPGGDMAAAAMAFRNGPLADPARTMMGAAQEKWLGDGLAASTAAGTRWQVIAQQVIMGPSLLPKASPQWFAAGATANARQQAELAVGAALGQLGIPFGLDRWDGYPAARTRLLDSARRAAANLVVLSGDSHNAWAFDLAQGKTPIGVEMAGQSVSSLGLDGRFGGDASVIAADFVRTNDSLKWCDTSRRGYMTIDLTRTAMVGEWLFLPSRDSQAIMPLGRHMMTVAHGARQFGAG